MSTKTLGTGGDYATFTAAFAGIATWDILQVITAKTYTEADYVCLSIWPFRRSGELWLQEK